MKQWTSLMLLTLAALPGFAAGLRAQVYPETDSVDHLQIRTTEDAVVAMRNQLPSAAVDLDLDERILSVRTGGLVGAVLTTRRLLVISAGARNWLEQALDFNEAFEGQIVLSRRIVLLLTLQRAVGYDGRSNLMVTYDLPLGEEVVAKAAGRKVAAFATSKRVVGFGEGSSDFTALEFDISEIFREMTISAGLVAVETSERLLTFQSSTGTWTTHSLE